MYTRESKSNWEEAMSYVATDSASLNGKTVGSGQCVAFVQQVSGAPPTSQWNQGKRVKGDMTIAKGTAIATFGSKGTYTNSLDGTSHAAIYVSQDGLGITVWDQWKGQPVHQRVIRFQKGASEAKPVNNGDAFYVID
jgi:hypothetical protein